MSEGGWILITRGSGCVRPLLIGQRQSEQRNGDLKVETELGRRDW